MSTVDYSAVTVSELEMQRVPRQAKITVLHKPSGTVAQNPVVPGAHTEARFRRPHNLPKENRVPNMEGYIEGRGDEEGLWLIVGGDSPRNEYLDALAKDAAALKISFEGGAVSPASAGSTRETPSPQKTVAEVAPEPTTATTAPEPTPQQAPIAATPVPDEPVKQEDLDQLDNLLATLEE